MMKPRLAGFVIGVLHVLAPAWSARAEGSVAVAPQLRSLVDDSLPPVP